MSDAFAVRRSHPGIPEHNVKRTLAVAFRDGAYVPNATLGHTTGAVDTIDFKGQYGFEVEVEVEVEVEDPEALSALYDHVIAAFQDAYLEDPPA